MKMINVGNMELYAVGYELVKKCLNCFPGKQSAKKIKSCIQKKTMDKGPKYLEEAIEKMPIQERKTLRKIIAKSMSYLDAIELYIEAAIVKNDSQAEDVFELFFDDINQKKDGREFVTRFAMKLKGLWDLVEIDLLSSETSQNDFIAQIAEHSMYDSPLLIEGETGTSKQWVTEVIHEVSNRRGKPLLDINCAALPESMIESELFGYKKGAFTGAAESKTGLFKKADMSTIFLDEIGKMPKPLQVKLLKVIETKKFYKLGEDKLTKIDVRFIAAIQPDDITKSNILPDLLGRLGYPDVMRLPNLMKRLNEMPESVIRGSLSMALKTLGLENENFTFNTDIIPLILKYPFERNYRDLENIFRSAIRSAKKNGRKEIIPEDLRIITETQNFQIDIENNIPQYNDEDLQNVRTKDIIKYAENEAKEITNTILTTIIERKLKKVFKTGKDIKTVLMTDEGLSKGGYQVFLRNVKRITGKKLQEIKKSI